jgi:hypothetical protein
VHRLPLAEVIGLKTGQKTVEKSGIHDGREIDLVMRAKKFFGLMLKNSECSSRGILQEHSGRFAFGSASFWLHC